MTFKLPSDIYSSELLGSVIFEIELYLSWYQEAKVHQKIGIKPHGEPTYSAETAAVIEVWFAAGHKPGVGALEALVKHLRGLDLPVVHVTLAALPNHIQRKKLVDWFHALTKQEMLISFVADRNIGGGITVRTPNRIFDYSWRQQLVNGRERIGEIISRV